MNRLALLAIFTSCLHAQDALKFEVASIKARPVTETNFSSGGAPSGSRLRLQAMSLENLVWWAYQVDYSRITGGPSWKTARYFDIEAEAEGDGPRPIEDFRVMLRNLLIDRFHLVVHNESRETAVFALNIDKGGLKMRESAPGAKSYISIDGAKLIGSATTLTTLVNFLSGRNAGRPVIDRSGLTGKFDFSLEWSIPRPDDTRDTVPDIFTAVREQLGLRLVPENTPLDYLVIDHAEMPTEN